MKKYRIGLVGFAHMHVLGQIKPFLSMPERVEWIGASDIKPMVESEYFESSSLHEPEALSGAVWVHPRV